MTLKEFLEDDIIDVDVFELECLGYKNLNCDILCDSGDGLRIIEKIKIEQTPAGPVIILSTE